MGWALSVLCAVVTVMMLAATSLSAQPIIAPTAKSYFSVTPVPFEQARLAIEQANNREAFASVAAAPTSAPPEIIELARALRYDPDLIYQYVHDNIEFSPLFGLLKGPVG